MQGRRGTPNPVSGPHVRPPFAAALSEGLLATRFGALPSSGRGRSTGQTWGTGPVVSLLAGGFAQLCPAENDVPAPAPRRPELGSATTALDCQLAQVTRDGSCFRSTARCTRPKRCSLPVLSRTRPAVVCCFDVTMGGRHLRFLTRDYVRTFCSSDGSLLVRADWKRAQ